MFWEREAFLSALKGELPARKECERIAGLAAWRRPSAVNRNQGWKMKRVMLTLQERVRHYTIRAEDEDGNSNEATFEPLARSISRS